MRRLFAKPERKLRHQVNEITPVSMGPEDGGARAEFDQIRAEKAVKELLLAIGEDPDREGLRDTPGRVARALRENFAGLWQKPEEVLSTTFDIGHRELVIVRDIEVFSHCEHHLTPFHGVAHIGYIPGEDGKITGLSKLARLVDMYSRRPQVQERLTSQIADAMVQVLNPAGVIVVINCEHLCMSMRGVKKSEARTITSAVRGQLRDAATRAEAISLITANSR
jgi:GTP cyclohydrolase IA